MSYESKILSETLGVSLTLTALTLFFSGGFARGSLRTAALCGGVLALAVLARASLLFCLPFFVIAAMLPWQRQEKVDRGARLRRAGLLARKYP